MDRKKENKKNNKTVWNKQKQTGTDRHRLKKTDKYRN